MPTQRTESRAQGRSPVPVVSDVSVGEVSPSPAELGRGTRTYAAWRSEWEQDYRSEYVQWQRARRHWFACDALLADTTLATPLCLVLATHAVEGVGDIAFFRKL